jgi:hypothetical protein
MTLYEIADFRLDSQPFHRTFEFTTAGISISLTEQSGTENLAMCLPGRLFKKQINCNHESSDFPT